METLGPRLRATRRQRTMSQAEAGEELGVAQQTVGKWEDGSPPSSIYFPVLSSFLGITEAELAHLVYGLGPSSDGLEDLLDRMEDLVKRQEKMIRLLTRALDAR